MQRSSSDHPETGTDTGPGPAEAGDRRSITAAASGKSQRLDRLLAEQIDDLSRTRLKALILAGHVSLGEAVVRDPAYQVKAGDTIRIEVPPAVDPEPAGENIPLNIVYEDDDIIVLDKQRGLVVHPAAGHENGTLVNALIAHCGASLSGIGGVKRPGIVHRLDKDTTGLMVTAKNDHAHQSLTAQFADHGRTGELRRGYLAFVWGAPREPRGTVDRPIDRHPHARDKMAVRETGREAITHWQVLERYPGPDGQPVASLVECRLETGRTHQIRVHLAAIGHPLIGDEIYGPGFRTKAAKLEKNAREAVETLGRQALHAHILGIEHPTSAKFLEFKSPLPPDLVRLRHALAPEQTGRRGAAASKPQ